MKAEQKKSTPWGKPQSIEQDGAGITFYSTASHGGYFVEPELNLEIPEIFRSADGWYEEDCQYVIVIVFLSAHFFDLKPEKYLAADQTLKAWYPHEWQEYCGAEIKPSASCWDCQKGRCLKAGKQYPNEVANTGYGRYRVITSEIEPNLYESVLTRHGKLVAAKLTSSPNQLSPEQALKDAHYNHGYLFDHHIDKEDAYLAGWKNGA